MRFIAIYWMLVLLLFTSSSYAQMEENNKKFQLQIKVTNIKKAKGVMRVAAYLSDQKFLGDSITNGVHVPVNEKGELIVLMNNLTLGTYAIAVHHDVDGDGDMDTNFLGIPKEPYGFSNDARGLFGPPKFSSCSFELMENQQMIELKVK